jgi:hypothetical protein
MAGEKKTLKFQMMMSPAEAETLDDWMFQNRIRSRAEAIRRLSQMGLALDEAMPGLVDSVAAEAERVLVLSQSVRAAARQENAAAGLVASVASQGINPLLQQISASLAEHIALSMQVDALRARTADVETALAGSQAVKDEVATLDLLTVEGITRLGELLDQVRQKKVLKLKGGGGASASAESRPIELAGTLKPDDEPLPKPPEPNNEGWERLRDKPPRKKK